MGCDLSLISDAFQSHGPHFPGKNTEVGCHALLQGILPTQGSNPGLLHCRRICFYNLSKQGRPQIFLKMVSSVQFSSVTQSCPTVCDPMDGSTAGLPVHHQHLELAQSHVHPVSDAIQPAHLLSSPSPPAFKLFQHQGLFQ